jgi:putative nucleotidyltransferase with HDIG domain/PAS domain S-box-containing protein
MKYWSALPLPLRVALLYLFFGLVWIFVSDTLLGNLASADSQYAWYQTYKGSLFVALSALFIGGTVHAESQRRSRVRGLVGELVDLLPDPVVIQRFETQEIVEVNERLAEQFDTSRERMVGQTFDELNMGLSDGGTELLTERVRTEGEVVDARHTLTVGENEVAELLISSRRVDMGEDDYICTVTKDITELEEARRELEEAYEETIRGWARALEFRDDETFCHTLRVTAGTLALAEKLEVAEPQLTHLRRGALLHDIGKIGVPDEILLKDGPLDDEERAVIERHPTIARDLLEPIDYLRPAIDIPYHHHEKWEGTGYPEGLAGEEIPLAARIFAVVDVWDALRSDRPYREAWEPERVLAHLEEGKGTHFQPEIVEAFFDLGGDRRAELRQVESPAELYERGSTLPG